MASSTTKLQSVIVLMLLATSVIHTNAFIVDMICQGFDLMYSVVDFVKVTTPGASHLKVGCSPCQSCIGYWFDVVVLSEIEVGEACGTCPNYFCLFVEFWIITCRAAQQKAIEYTKPEKGYNPDKKPDDNILRFLAEIQQRKLN